MSCYIRIFSGKGPQYPEKGESWKVATNRILSEHFISGRPTIPLVMEALGGSTQGSRFIIFLIFFFDILIFFISLRLYEV